MSLQTKVVSSIFAVAFVCGSAAAGEGVVAKTTTIPKLAGQFVSCPAGFTASPVMVDPKNPYGQKYTCTGPVAFCMKGFSLVAPVVGYGPVPPGGLIGKVFYGSPVTIDTSEHMVFTCQQPPAPPK